MRVCLCMMLRRRCNQQIVTFINTMCYVWRILWQLKPMDNINYRWLIIWRNSAWMLFFQLVSWNFNRSTDFFVGNGLIFDVTLLKFRSNPHLYFGSKSTNAVGHIPLLWSQSTNTTHELLYSTAKNSPMILVPLAIYWWPVYLLITKQSRTSLSRQCRQKQNVYV